MLVLSRFPDQCLVIGDPTSDDCVVIVVESIKLNGEVKLAISAPQSTKVDRGEITRLKLDEAGRFPAKAIASTLDRYHPSKMGKESF